MIMKTALPVCLIAAALATTPMPAAANHCGSDMKHKKRAYYDHPHHQHYYRSMPMQSYYAEYPRPHWHVGRHANKSQSGGVATSDASTAETEPADNIIDTAINAGSFSTLIDALKTAELVETLQDPGPFTVFAPSDAAFAKIPGKIRAAIIVDKKALTELLSYHVLQSEVTAADAARLDSATTVRGSAVSIDTSDGIKVDGANLVTADIRASNGIIHVIDAVLIPNRKRHSHPVKPHADNRAVTLNSDMRNRKTTTMLTSDAPAALPAMHIMKRPNSVVRKF
jgi:uncharacterized surface protein with fasciclin (FAS1) repeats